MQTKLIFTNLVGTAIDDLAASISPNRTVIITDVNTATFALPLLTADSRVAAGAEVITVKAGDANKNLSELTTIWSRLSEMQASRSTLVINLGGGVITDMGGFAAATFKRGLRCINVPTTLLGAVDAAVGGKTGVNFNGLKNQIGVFSEPEAVIISTLFFNTLTRQDLLSGYGEMLKHALLETPEVFASLLAYSPVYPVFDSERLLPLLEKSVSVKQRIVEADPTERGLRKALNLGHTAGHAFETLALERHSPVPHGYAVVWGLVVELVLSHLRLGFPSGSLHQFASYVHTNYGAFDITCDDYPRLISIMRQDKKNTDASEINFTLLQAIGDPRIDSTATPDEIGAALDIYRDLMHL